MARNKEATGFIIKIAVILSLVCAALVSVAAVGLKSIQDKNAALEKKLNIVSAAGIYKAGDDVDKLFADNIVSQAIDLKTGLPTDAVDVETFNAVKAAKDAKLGLSLSGDQDLAKIGSISKYEVVYFLKEGDKISKVILPVRGYGLWGTMYGFLALDKDGKTVKGLTFYDQKETPGLGAEIVNPKWQQLWVDKKPFDSANQPAIKLVKNVSTNPEVAAQQVDALAGATLTSRGVENMVNFWLGENGYKPFLTQFVTQ